LRHIFTNAVQYTPADGRIIVNTFTREQSVVIEVQDTGVGIPPDDLAHIFDRY
jgi:signal transduction histidine kinase